MKQIVDGVEKSVVILDSSSQVVMEGGYIDSIVGTVTVHLDSSNVNVSNKVSTDLTSIGGVPVSSSLYDTTNSSLQVSVVSGTITTGPSETQVQDSSGNWTNVGYAPGDLNIPVQIEGTVPLPTGAATEVTLGGIKTQTDKLTFDSSSNLEVRSRVVVNDPIVVSGFDLQAAPFSQATTITQNYEFNSVQLFFSTTQTKTITITNSDGVILFGGTNAISKNNLGYLTKAQTFNLVFDQVFSANDNITIAVTQTAGADLLSVRMITTLL